MIFLELPESAEPIDDIADDADAEIELDPDPDADADIVYDEME
jgi:hypothetical protein